MVLIVIPLKQDFSLSPLISNHDDILLFYAGTNGLAFRNQNNTEEYPAAGFRFRHLAKMDDNQLLTSSIKESPPGQYRARIPETTVNQLQ